MLLRQIVSPAAGTVAPVTGRRLKCEKLSAPAFGRNAGPLRCYCAGGVTRKVSHDLPADRRIGIEQPFQMCGPRRIIADAHCPIIAAAARLSIRGSAEARDPQAQARAFLYSASRRLHAFSA